MPKTLLLIFGILAALVAGIAFPDLQCGAGFTGTCCSGAVICKDQDCKTIEKVIECIELLEQSFERNCYRQGRYKLFCCEQIKPTVHGYPVNDGINCYNPARVGIPAEHPSEREVQNNNNNIIIKDFPGVFVRPPFFQSPPSPPPTPPSQEDDPAHPVCRSQKLRRRDGGVVTRTRQSGEVAVLHAINVRSAAALDDDAKECQFHSSNADGDDSSSIGDGYSESSAGGGDAAAVKFYQGSGEDTFLLSNNGQTPDLGLAAAAPVEVATNTVDASSRWEPLSLDTSSEDISHLNDQLTYSSGNLQKDVQVQENSAQEGPTL